MKKVSKSTYNAFDEVGSFEAPEGGKSMYWAHPVVCGGRLYIRDQGTLTTYNVGK